MSAATTRVGLDSAVDERALITGWQGVEEDLFSLDVMAPALLQDVPAIFEQTVRESLSYMVGAGESSRVLAWFHAGELACRQDVFARLSAVYGERASPIESVIDRVFGLRVHELVRKLP